MNKVWKLWSLPLLVVVLTLIVQISGAAEALRYERALIGMQPWRLFTGHLVHLGWMHLLLNLLGLVLIWALFGRYLRLWVWGTGWLVCSAGIGIGLYLRDVELAWYVGLSGVLHGLLVLGALAAMRSERRLALLLLVGVAAKLVWEQFSGGDTGTAQLVGGVVIVNAHLYGALAGLACAPLACRRCLRMRA